MRGRKPLPTARRVLDGNAGRRPLNANEPKHDRIGEAFDTPPPELDGNVRARAEWARLVPMLRRSNHISGANRGALLALCIEWSRYLDAMAKVAVLGMVVKAPSGYPMTNPYLSIATRALAACNKLWPELGLTPSSRSRVTTTGAGAEDDPFNEFDTPADDDATTH